MSIHLAADGPALDGDARLAALLRWLRAEAPSYVAVFDAHGRRITEPLMVNWDRFPLQTAIEAVQVVEQRVSL